MRRGFHLQGVEDQSQKAPLRYVLRHLCEGASIHWLMDEILQALRAHWDSPAFKKKQVKAWTSSESTRGGFLHTGGSTTIEGTRLRMVNIIFFLFSFSIFILNVIYIIKRKFFEMQEKAMSRPPTQGKLFQETYTRKQDMSQLVDMWLDTIYVSNYNLGFKIF